MKLLIKHLFLFAFIGVLFLIFHFFSIPCPFKYFFHSPCLTCGATRAFLSLLSLDFKSYLYYNAMAVPLSIAIILGIHLKLFKGKMYKLVRIFIILTIILSLIYNIYRILCNVQI